MEIRHRRFKRGIVDNAKNVTETIGGRLLSSIFVGNTSTVQNASYAVSAGTADQAKTATNATTAKQTSFYNYKFEGGTSNAVAPAADSKFYYVELLTYRNSSFLGGVIVPAKTTFVVPCYDTTISQIDERLMFYLVNFASFNNTYTVVGRWDYTLSFKKDTNVRIRMQAIK